MTFDPEEWAIALAALVFASLLVFVGVYMLHEDIEDAQKFSVYLREQERQCLLKHEDPYVCKTYITALKTQHDAEESRNESAMAAGFAGASLVSKK